MKNEKYKEFKRLTLNQILHKKKKKNVEWLK